MTKRYQNWHGLLVTEEDHAALESDFRLSGNAIVEKVGEGYARRINPKNFYIRSRRGDGETTQPKKEG